MKLQFFCKPTGVHVDRRADPRNAAFLALLRIRLFLAKQLYVYHIPNVKQGKASDSSEHGNIDIDMVGIYTILLDSYKIYQCWGHSTNGQMSATDPWGTMMHYGN